jgi:putative zinc finger protein
MTFRGRGSRRPDDWPTIHDRARSALSDQLDGELDDAETAWLDEHLAGCPDCRATADAYAAQRFELRALRDRAPIPPRDLWARTAAAIEAEAGGRSRSVGWAPRRLILVPSALIATALVVAVAVGTLTSSQLVPHGGSSPGSSQEVAVASSASRTPGDVAAGPTPIPLVKDVEYLARDAQGNFKINVKKVSQVCPEGSTGPCDTTAPVEETTVTVDQNAQAVFGDADKQRLIVVSSPTTDDSGTISVVAIAEGSPAPSSEPSATPTSSASPATTPSVEPSDEAHSIEPSSPPPSATPTVSATPTGSIDVTPPGGGTIQIAHGVVLVGQTAAYSTSGAWFAFTARPIDATSGPDIYVWRVGSPTARKVTADGRSVFGSWAGDLVVGSSAADDQTGTATSGIRPEAFLLDPETGARSGLPQTGAAWRPVVDPEGRKAVYWSGTLRTVGGPGFAPDAGRLVLGDWAVTSATASASPNGSAAPHASGSADASSSLLPTPLATDQTAVRHETTIAAGRMDDWDARWDPTGTHLAIWIADHENPAIGRLSLYAVSAFDGTIDVKSPLLNARRAVAGFSISNGSLVWAEPSTDPASSDGTIQLLAWTDDGVGTVQTQSGPALVIR